MMTESMPNQPIQQLPPIEGITITGEPYVGSVQVLHPVRYAGMPGPGLITQSTDRGSVFDVGTFFEIAGSGEARTALRHQTFSAMADPRTWGNLTVDDFRSCLTDPIRISELRGSPTFTRLCSEGMPTHHVGIIDRETGRVVTGPTDTPSDLTLIQRFPVVRPHRTTLFNTLAYDYHDYTLAARKIMALEHLVRLGNAGGSSLQDRYDRLMLAGNQEGAQDFLAHYGLQPPLERWGKLPNITFDWTTKHEAADRHLSLQETLHIAGVGATVLRQAIDMLTFSTIYANKHFADLDLQLWDMKWEIAVDGDRLVLADTLDHDSLRITSAVEYMPGVLCRVHFNKQAMRDYLRIKHPDWYKAVLESRQRAGQEGNRWTFMELYNQGVKDGHYPPIPQIDPVFTDLQSRKYQYVTAQGDASVDRTTAAELCTEEIEYYRGQGLLDAFLERNAVPKK